MHRTLIVAVVLSLVLVGLVASSAPRRPACSKVGTKGNDVLAGGPGGDRVCALGGRDYISGRGGNDALLGDQGRDTIVGGSGRDRLRGGAGRDKLFAVEGRGGDRLEGGDGRDRCFADFGDRVTGCERVFRGVTEEFARSLSGSFGGAVALGEFYQDAGGTITETVTVTVPLRPECSPPPASPPPVC